jgi:3-deoxy-manno-octulosonate cytidylyltransferase (CMP-KDO synthetase)
MKIIGIIPARYASTRFPGKPLVEISGKSMIRRVWEQCRKSTLLEEVAVATDDERILRHVEEFGGRAILTAETHQSGTERCAEAAAQFPEADVVINIQGDEPFIAPEQIDQLAGLFRRHPQWSIATLAKQIREEKQLFSSDVVKVVFNLKQEALYFSRQPLPYLRDTPREEWLSKGMFFKHIGLYGYKRETLIALSRLLTSPLEQEEKLEQLRWLENGYRIGLGITEYESRGIDRPEDLL